MTDLAICVFAFGIFGLACEIIPRLVLAFTRFINDLISSER